MPVQILYLTPTSPPFLLFFFNDTATTEIYTLSLHDALPICSASLTQRMQAWPPGPSTVPPTCVHQDRDRKSTRLNSSHLGISYAVFCLKKKYLHSISITGTILKLPDCCSIGNS